MSEHGHPHRHTPFYRTHAGMFFFGFLAIAIYFLIVEHGAHVAAALPYFAYLLLLACPLLHFFMHRGHGHQDGHNDEGGAPR